eukprot:TRINITY_DN11964_c0_g1_i2.p1 TRINITY_DN11964_c0_g1~~TRINITY_DN11964_c0_g1_i2.p1  ORF type:complete len:528 (-),score=119.97 TRINITY_DN11964_c0_g1_i2:522-2105(-)
MKITVIKKAEPRNVELKKTSFSQFLKLLSPDKGHWCPSLDNVIAKTFGISGSQIPYNNTPADILYGFKGLSELDSKIKSVSNEIVLARASLIAVVNQMLTGVLEFIDFEKFDQPWSFAHIIHKSREFIFYYTKKRTLDKFLEMTQFFPPQNQEEYEYPEHCPVVNIDKTLARKCTEIEDEQERMSKSVFGQIVAHFRNKEERYNWLRLRQSTIGRLDAGQQRAFRVVLVGFGVDDHGGPYSGVFTDICSELQSSILPFFIPSPNQASGVGKEREKWIINPSRTSELDLEWYRHFGRILGIALRSNIPLPINLPSLFWKMLVGDEVTVEDLELIDVVLVRYLFELKNITKEEFDEKYGPGGEELTFTCYSGKLVELVPNGKQYRVTWENKDEYVASVLKCKLRESEKQVEAITEGLYSIIPHHVNCICLWDEFQLLICGIGNLDLDMLQKYTDYCDGTSPEDRHVKYFWSVMRSFSAEECSQFLRFAYARSHLPSGGLEMNFKIYGKFFCWRGRKQKMGAYNPTDFSG